jgi:hypothetical protein
MSFLLLGRSAARRIHSAPSRCPRPSLLTVRAATSAANPPSSRRSFGILGTISLVSAVSLGAYTFGAIYPPPPLSLLYPRPAPPPPADVTSPESLAYTAALEAELQALPVLREMRTCADADE